MAQMSAGNGGGGWPRTLSPTDMLWLSHSGGFSWNGLAIAAIGTAESHGDTHAVHVNKDGSRDRGWLQINDKAHPDITDACAFDPVCAVNAAYKIWKEAGGAKGDSGYKIWSTYGGKDYKDAANSLLAHGGYKGGVPKLIQSGGSDGVFPKVTNPISTIGDFLKLITSQHFLLDAGKVLLGVTAIIMGVRQIMQTYNIPTPHVPKVIPV